jgi:hypothetical protein
MRLCFANSGCERRAGHVKWEDDEIEVRRKGAGQRQTAAACVVKWVR